MTDRRTSKSLDMEEVAQLFEDVYSDEKRSEIELEGNAVLPSTTPGYKRTHTKSDTSHTMTTRGNINSQINSVHHSESTALPMKAYFIAGYQILMHLLLIYCVIGITYLLLTNNQNETHCECTQVITDSGSSDVSINYDNSTTRCECSNFATTEAPTTMPTELPSITPSISPTYKPTVPPTYRPTVSPTYKPTGLPTQDFNGYRHYVGDYKISAQNTSHGYWKLCDGSFLDSVDYPELFEVIGNSFGSFSGYPSLFAVPNGTNNVLGINSEQYAMGVVFGNEYVTLSESNLPSHYHLLIGASGCAGYGSLNSNNYLSIDCNFQNDDNFHIAAASSTSATKGRSSSVGSNEPINIYQPTIYVGNLFIYAARL